MEKINDIKLYTVELPVFLKYKSIFATTEEEAKAIAFQRAIGKFDVEDKLGLVLICPDQSIVEEDDSEETKQFLNELKQEVKKIE